MFETHQIIIKAKIAKKIRQEVCSQKTIIKISEFKIVYEKIEKV